MKCIICKLEKPESEEHILPESIGNKSLITRRVCKTCNDRLGSNVDKSLTDHAIVKMYRKKKGLLGKKDVPIKILDGKESDVKTGREFLIRNNIPLLMPRIIEQDKDHYVVEASSFEEGVNYFTKILQRKNYSETEISSLLKRAYCVEGKSLKPTFQVLVEHNYKALAMEAIKIAYEYTFVFLGEKYLKDQIGNLYCEELLRAINAQKRVEISDELSEYVIYPLEGSGLQILLTEHRKQLVSMSFEIAHSIFCVKEGSSLYCVINLFNSNRFSCAVKVTDNEQLYNYKLPVTLLLDDGSTVSL